MVIENFRTGTLAKWGIGADVLREANPDIIVTHITGCGQTGPNAKLAGLGLPLGAFSGMTYLQGYPDRAPVSPPFARDALKGTGQEVDVSLYEGLFRMEENFVAQLSVLGINKERTPMPGGASCPIGTHETKDGKWAIIVCSTNPVFEHLCDAMERPDWLPKYALSKDRLANQDELNNAMKEWINSLTYAELKERCDKAGVPVSYVMSMQDIFNDPHYKARNDIVDVQVEESFGHVKMPNAFPFMTGTPGRIKWPGQKLGASNEAVYKGLLGMTDEEIAGLKEKKVI